MKRFSIWIMAIGFVISLAGTGIAADTDTLTVSAVVQGTCIIGGPATLAFGVLDPVAGPDPATATVNMSFTCSNGTPYAVTDDNGIGSDSDMQAGLGGPDLVYTLSYLPGGTGTGAPQAHTFNGSILKADYSVATPDIYSDSVVITLNP